MKWAYSLLLLVMISMCGIPAVAQEDQALMLKAFPGAEGFGACAVGGRGGQVYYVTTLEDYLPDEEPPIEGSLRAAVRAKGPRYVLFRVSGTIDLKTDLAIRNPYITLAGQTAPGDGICLKDHMLVLNTHDAIIRHMRFRSGDVTQEEQMAVGIFGGTDSILDHCSMSWAIDEVMTYFGARNITAQWCIVAEGLSRSYHPKGEHSKGSILNGDGGMSILHCIYAHNSARNPKSEYNVLDFRNNVLYNWGYRGGYSTAGPLHMNYIANYIKPGPSTTKSAKTKVFQPGDAMVRMYVRDNYMEGYPKETADNTRFLRAPKGYEKESLLKTVLVEEAFPVPVTTTETAQAAMHRILAEAGATLPKRDSADARLMQEIATGTGRIIDSQDEVGGWPVLRTVPPVLDQDADGMPDAWEEKYRFDPKDPADTNLDADNDGYTNLEEFLNGTDPHEKERDCWVDATAFRAVQDNAVALAKQGQADWEARKNNADAVHEQRRKEIMATLPVTLQPATIEGREGLEVHLGDQATITMVKIPAGSFMMGSPEHEGGLPREWPQHKVNISKPFYMATTLTTTTQFLTLFGKDYRVHRPGEERFPMHEPDWFEAEIYCAMLSNMTGNTFRLPTEAEWEYTCRAGTTTPFNTGETITTNQANFDGEAATRFSPAGVNRGKKIPVASFPPNAWGLYDMHGNAAEYCQDCCYRVYTDEEVTDPLNAGDNCARVLRGGKETSKAEFIRSAYRYGYAPAVGYGFRVVMEAE